MRVRSVEARLYACHRVALRHDAAESPSVLCCESRLSVQEMAMSHADMVH